GRSDVRVPEDDQGAGLQHRHELELGVQHGHQGGLAAHQRSGDVEAVLGQQRVQVVPGDPAGDVRVAGTDLLGVVVPQAAQRAVDGGPPVAVAFDLPVLGVADVCGPDQGACVGVHTMIEDV